MNRSSQQETIVFKLINATLQSDANSGPPFQCLLNFPDTKIVIQVFCSVLEKTRDSAIRVRISRIFQDFFIQKSSSLNDFNEDFILNALVTVCISTPPFISQKDCELYTKFVKDILKLLNTTKIPIIFNNLVKTNSVFAPLGIVILTKGQPKLFQSTIKFIIAMLVNNLDILNIAACALFFSQNKFSALPESAQNEFNSSNTPTILQQVIIKSMSLKINFRLSAIELCHSLFHFYQPREANLLLKTILPLFIQQFKESAVSIRTNVVLCLSDFPEIEDDKGLLSTILPHIASRFDECDDDYAVAVFSFLKHFASSPFMNQTILSLISKDQLISGVIFSAYLGYFEDLEFRKRFLPPTSKKSDEATAAVMAVNTMGIYQLFNKSNFKDSFEAIMIVMTTPELLDDFFIQFRVFKAADSIVDSAEQFPQIISSTLYDYLPKLKGDDVLSHIAPIIEKITNSPDLATLSSNEFAPIFVALMMKFINDPSARNLIFPFLLLISPNKSKSKATIDLMLCDLFDLIVPTSFVDAIRTEAILQSQNAPRAALIAVSLPNCGPFLPTLSRAVRELYPEDPELTLQFLQNASKRALNAFIPHLKRFTEPVKISSTYFLQIVSIKRNKRLHLKEIFQCLTFIARELSPPVSILDSLLSIMEESFPKETKIENMKEEALASFIEMSKIGEDKKWPPSLLKKIFSFSYFSPSFHLLFNHCPDDIELIKLATDSYALYVSKGGEHQNNLFADSCLKCCPTQEALASIIKSSFKYISQCDDCITLLNLVLAAIQIFRQSKDEIPTGIFDSIIGLAKFCLSNNEKLRLIAKDIFISLYSLKISADISTIIESAEDVLTPFQVIDFASQLFNLVFQTFSAEESIDFALFTGTNRPLSFTHVLILNSLTDLQPQALVTTPKKFLIQFFEIGEQTQNESRLLMHRIAKKMAKIEMPIFLEIMLKLPMTNFISEIIANLIKDDEFSPSFYSNFSKIALSTQLPVSQADQLTFLTSNFMQAIPIIIHNESQITERIDNLATYLTIWLSNIYAVNQPQKMQNQLKILIESNNELFVKIGKNDHDPIEFSLKSVQALYQSFGTLVNALLLTDSKIIITFCESLFELLKIQTQHIVLISSLCVSRIFHRLVQYSDQSLIEKLKDSVALSFSVSCDENCRFLAAVMNDIFSRSLFESFSDENATNILIGTIRGVAYPGLELKNESVAFLCKITVVFSKDVITPQLERLWQIMREQDFAPIILSAISALLSVDNNVEHLTGKITIDRLIMAAVSDTAGVPKNSRMVLETLTNAKGMNELLPKLKELIQKSEFHEVCSQIISRVNRSNLTENILDLLFQLNELETEDTKFKEKLIALLLSCLDDPNNPLRQIASERLSTLF